MSKELPTPCSKCRKFWEFKCEVSYQCGARYECCHYVDLGNNSKKLILPQKGY